LQVSDKERISTGSSNLTAVDCNSTGNDKNGKYVSSELEPNLKLSFGIPFLEITEDSDTKDFGDALQILNLIENSNTFMRI